jgi:hypothetical protein
MRAIATALIAGAVSIAVAPASAEKADPAATPQGARVVMAQYSSCAVKTAKSQVERLLTLSPDSKQAKALEGHLLTNACPKFEMLSFDRTLLRGSLYRALYQRDFSAQAGPLSATPIDFAKDRTDPAQPAARQYIAMRKFAQCVIQSDADKARAFVLKPVESAEEKAALGALKPVLASCLQDGASVSLTKTMLSAALSEVLYRLSKPEYATFAGNS